MSRLRKRIAERLKDAQNTAAILTTFNEVDMTRVIAVRERHRDVVWRGVVPRHELPAIYSAADAFVFPGRAETFGLVMLEALACGTPVAAYPVAGPLDVVGDSDGGVLHDDLGHAAMAASQVPREAARRRAQAFDWDRVAQQFIEHLVPAHPGAMSAVAPAPAAAG